jgi:hypothetical protein
MFYFWKLEVRIVSIIWFIVVGAGMCYGQWNSGTINLDGDDSEPAYVSDSNYSIAWDSSYLYLVKKNHTANEPVIFYFDIDPQYSVFRGGNSAGSLVGKTDWQITPNLPFRADFRLYFESDTATFCLANGSNGWTTEKVFSSSEFEKNASDNRNREIRISWDSMGISTLPSAFNFFAFCTTRGSLSTRCGTNLGCTFHVSPPENPDGNCACGTCSEPCFYTPNEEYYWATGNTSPYNGTSFVENPFDYKSYSYLGTGGSIGNLSGLHDFTHKVFYTTIRKTGKWSLTGNLIIDGEGSIIDFATNTDSLIVGDSISILNGQLLLENSTAAVLVNKGFHNYDTFIGSDKVASIVHVKGNFSNSRVFNPDSSKFVFNRSSTAQTITGDLDTSNAFTRIEINNPDGVINNCNDTLTIRDTLFLTNGIISNSKVIRLRNNAFVTPIGGKKSSHILGKVAWEVFDTDSVILPLGDSINHAPMGVYPRISDSRTLPKRTFVGEYFLEQYSDVQNFETQSPQLHHVSYIEYWELDEISNADSAIRDAKVSLYWSDTSHVDPVAIARDSLLVCHYDVSTNKWSWVSDRCDVNNVSQSFGWAKTRVYTDDFSPFTFGSLYASNPLPVNLTFFRAEKLSDDQNLIAWQTAAEWNCKSFEVFHELNGEKSFLHQLKCSENSTSIRDYSFVHPQPQSQEIYWLKQIDYDGKVAWYGPRIVTRNQNLTLYPNPAQNHLHILTKDDIARVDLIDALGKTTSFESESLNRLNISGLRSGLYQVVISFKSQKPVRQTLLIAR